ncbi:MAG TPA: AAA family ATPase [Arthrobacter sp.]
MRIINLQAENVKRLKAVEITPDGNTVILAGANAQGKSSILDAIWLALGGGPAAKQNSRVIRDGEKEASVRLDLGDIVVTRKWKGEKTSLTVENAEGAKYSSPQSMLDGLVGRLSFDPQAFALQDEKTQLKSLLDVVTLPFDPVEVENTRKELYEDRTVVGRDVKQWESTFAGLHEAPEGTPDEEVSVTALLADFREGEQAHNERLKQTLVAKKLESDIAANRERIAELGRQIADDEANLADITKKLEWAPPLPDLTVIQDQMSNAEGINQSVRAKKHRADVETKMLKSRREYGKLTRQLEELDTLKAKGIKEAALPLEGLGFDDTGVTYNNVPLKQASSAEQLRVSTAMGMALNPKLRMMHIRDGSLLDSTNLALLNDMAAANDFQLWIERVDESGSVGIIIEDGQVKNG